VNAPIIAHSKSSSNPLYLSALSFLDSGTKASKKGYSFGDRVKDSPPRLFRSHIAHTTQMRPCQAPPKSKYKIEISHLMKALTKTVFIKKLECKPLPENQS